MIYIDEKEVDSRLENAACLFDWEEHDKQIRNETIDELIRWMLTSRPDTVADYKCSGGVVRNRPLYDCATICEKLEQMKEEQNE